MALTNCEKLTPNQAIETIAINFEGQLAIRREDNRVPIMSYYLEGSPGVGKTSIGKQIAKYLNYYFVDIRANQMNPDVAGGTFMPDYETKTTDWFAPEWLPNVDGKIYGPDGKELLNEEGKPYDGTLLFFDELAAADDRVRKPLFGCFLERNLNGRPIPENCLIIGAGNEAETGTQVMEFDNATRTRFITYRIVADFDSWVVDYAPAVNMSPTVISTLKQNVNAFDETMSALEKEKALYGNPRSWEQLSVMERSIMRTKEDRQDERKVAVLQRNAAGKVGIANAGLFMGVFASTAQMSTLYDILKAKKEQRKQMWPKSLGQLHALCFSMMAYPSKPEQAKEIYDLMDEFPGTEQSLPFNDMKTGIREVVLKRMKAAGYTNKDLAGLQKGNAESSAVVFSEPLIKIKL